MVLEYMVTGVVVCYELIVGCEGQISNPDGGVKEGVVTIEPAGATAKRTCLQRNVRVLQELQDLKVRTVMGSRRSLTAMVEGAREVPRVWLSQVQ